MPVVARADVDLVTTSPTTASISAKRAETISVTWNVNRTEAVGDGTGGPAIRTVSSSSATLQINGLTIATLEGSLSKDSGNLVAAASETITFSETLDISLPLARRIASAAPGSATIQRIFTDTQRAETGNMKLFSTLGAVGPLAVRRIDLHFENDARTDVINKGDTIRAVADVNFLSNGLLRGEWRIVDPTASLGVGTGRVIQVVRQQLISSAEGRARIVSPPLPTKENGLYLVSFSVEDTDSNIETPILRYFVLEGHDDVPPINLSVLTPGNGVYVSEETEFSWKMVAGASAYQLEILEKNNANPVAGKVVPGTDLKLSLSALTFDNLVSGKIYDWRVRAFANGQAIGQSELQTLHVP